MDKGRVHYVEPTNIFLQRDGSYSDAINFPYEDLNIAVDLSIRKVNRYSCGWWLESGDEEEITYSSHNGTISFLGGTRGYESLINGDDSYLTTNYTDVSMTSPETNTSECLGIESISITYNSWMYPQVVIKFVDVRGATVMQPAERAYYNPNDVGNASELYKCLFSFPYPIFTLKVKGFYGKGVTYKLAVEKTDLEFDSNTGNFNITVSFIGYMFGVYADIPMTYLAIAPYTLTGKKYWQDKIQSGDFRFMNSNGEPSADMLTIPELRMQLARAANSEESISVAADGVQVQNNYDERISKLETIQTTFPFKDWFETEGVPYLYKVCKTEDEMDSFQNTVSGFVTTVSGYDYTYGTKFLSYIEDLTKYAEEKFKIPVIEYVSAKNEYNNSEYTYKDDFLTLIGDTNKVEDEKYVQKYGEKVKTYIDRARGKLTNFYLYVFPKNSEIFSPKYFDNLITEERNTINQKKNNDELEYKSKQNSIIEKAIGFRPSIRNIFNLMFAHMDTFMHCFYSSTKRIKDQLEGDKTKRAKSHYGVVDGDTDTEREKILTSNGEVDSNVERSHYLPPYAAYYKPTYMNGETKKVLRWPEELVNGKDLEEVTFVKELLLAAELYAEKAESVEEFINLMSGETKTLDTTFSNGTPNPMVYDFIPLTTFDFVYKDLMDNPYSVVTNSIYNGDIANGEILGIFAMRAFYYLASNPESNRDAKSFGTLEAINLYKAVKDRYSDGFVKFIKQFADDNRSNRKAFIKTITTTEETEYTKVWRTEGAPNLNKNLFTEVGNSLVFNYHKGFTIDDSKINEDGCLEGTNHKVSANTLYQMFPLFFNSFQQLRGDYVNEKNILGNRNYISVMNDGVLYGSDKETVSTFVMYEARDYIKNVYTCLDDEVRRTQEYLKENNKNYGNRKGDEYGDIKRSNRTIKEYKDNIDEEFGEKSYEKDIIVDSEEKSVGLGKIKDVISNGSFNDQKSLYIMYPAIMDENEDDSLFDEEIYLIQDDIRAKAFLFLQAIPIKGNGSTGGIEDANDNGLTLKVRLLREGSYYWRCDNPDVIKFEGVYEGKTIPTKKFKQPTTGQTFFGDSIINGYETLRMLYTNDSGDYAAWKEPAHNTASRKKVLKKYFEEWALSTDNDSGFAANEGRLRNKKLYNKKPNFLQREKYASENSRTYGMGLDIDGLVTSGLQTADATDAKQLQVFLRNLFFTVCTTFDMYNVASPVKYAPFMCETSAMKSAFEGFMEELELIYGQTVKDIEKNPDEYNRKMAEAEAKNPFKNDDLRLSTYMTLKSLYDKWLCSPYNGAKDTWSLRRGRNDKSDFNNFVYADSFYHDIGDQLIVNISKVSSWLSSCLPTSNLNSTEGVLQYTGRTIYEFLTEVSQDCGGTLLALPQKFSLTGAKDITEMFTPISIKNDWDDDSSSFIFMYTYKPSEHLGSVDPGNMDMNGWSPEGDGIDLTDDEIVGKILSDDGYAIPAFGVTYGKQNQSYFKNIKLSTASAGVTEAGLAATFNIASKGSESPRESTLYGQDLYRVFSQYSFQCGVEMMGNMQITPLMYFQLNNIPMWKGAYMIKKVSHNIAAGNMTTSFEGIRINKYAIPLTDSAVIIPKNTGGEGVDNSSEYPVGGDNNPTTGDGGLVSKGKDVNIAADPNTQITDTIDFVPSNVSKQKPIICLTPPHGPKTQKRQEWEWGTKLVDAIVEKLKKEKYKDGTPLNVQRCNKGGKHYGKNGYSTIETQNIIKKYGSENVISVVPHWNGAAGNYHGTFVNKVSKGVREDSMRLAECMVPEFLKIKEQRHSLNIPEGMMDGACDIKNLGESNSDGAPQLNCACVMTENWFADYPAGCNWSNDSTLGDPTYSGRAWLMSEEGIRMVSTAHVNGIKRYIETLS